MKLYTISIIYFVFVQLVSAQWTTTDLSTNQSVKYTTSTASLENAEVSFGQVHFGDSKEWFVKNIPIWSTIEISLDGERFGGKTYKAQGKRNLIIIDGLSEEPEFEKMLLNARSLLLKVTKGDSVKNYNFNLVGAKEKINELATKVPGTKSPTNQGQQYDVSGFEPNNEEPLIMVDEFPLFRGCEDKACSDAALIDFVQRHLEYPKKARKKGIQGQIFVQFIVEKDGRVSNPKILREIGGGCGQAGIDVVLEMNRLNTPWTPGKKNNVPVRVLYTLPLTFALTK